MTIVKTSNDGVTYVSREGGHPAELVIEFEPVEDVVKRGDAGK